jgi:hypothetical protein
MEEKPKPGTPEWMKYIQARAMAKKAEQRKIKEAEKLKKTTTHSQKLKEANEVLNQGSPKPAEPTPEPVVENEPLPPKTKAPARRTLDLQTDDIPTKKTSYKEEYYKRKLELLDRQPQQPQQGNPAYALAKHEIKQHVDRNVMKQVWSELFSGTECPY